MKFTANLINFSKNVPNRWRFNIRQWERPSRESDSNDYRMSSCDLTVSARNLATDYCTYSATLSFILLRRLGIVIYTHRPMNNPVISRQDGWRSLNVLFYNRISIKKKEINCALSIPVKYMQKTSFMTPSRWLYLPPWRISSHFILNNA